MQDDQRMTDSLAIRSSCSCSPRPIVRFLLLWILDILDLGPLASPDLVSDSPVSSTTEEFGSSAVFSRTENWLECLFISNCENHTKNRSTFYNYFSKRELG